MTQKESDFAIPEGAGSLYKQLYGDILSTPNKTEKTVTEENTPLEEDQPMMDCEDLMDSAVNQKAAEKSSSSSSQFEEHMNEFNLYQPKPEP